MGAVAKLLVSSSPEMLSLTVLTMPLGEWNQTSTVTCLQLEVAEVNLDSCFFSLEVADPDLVTYLIKKLKGLVI